MTLYTESIKNKINNNESLNIDDIISCLITSENIINSKPSNIFYKCLRGEFNDAYNQDSKEFEETILKMFRAKFYIDWDYLSYTPLSENLLREVINNVYNEIHWNGLMQSSKLSESFLLEFQDKFKWFNISTSKYISDEFINKYKDKIDWKQLTTYHILTKDFVIRFQEKANS